MIRTVNEVVDDLGVGRAQLQVMLLAGGIYTLGGEVTFLMSTFVVPIGKEFGLNAHERASLGSIVFVGMLLGNLACCMNDSLGRRHPILCAQIGILLFFLASSYANSYELLLILWFLTGISYGIGVPSFNALVTETTPSEWRLGVNAVALLLFSVWGLQAALVVFMYAPDLHSVGEHWRTIVRLERIPNLLIVVLGFLPGFVESAHFLACAGKEAAARRALETMRKQNGRPDVSIECNLAHDEAQANSGISELLKGFGVLFGRHFLGTTIVVGLVTYLLNFIGFGANYTLPIILAKVDLNMSPALSLAVASGFEIVGYVGGILIEPVATRRVMLSIFLGGCMISSWFFIYGVQILEARPESRPGISAVLVGVNGIRVFTSVGWIAAYVYAGEAFPTSARATASGVCIGLGRLGSFSAPWVFEHLMAYSGGMTAYSYLTSGLCGVTIIGVLAVLRETKGVPLEDVAPLTSDPNFVSSGETTTFAKERGA